MTSSRRRAAGSPSGWPGRAGSCGLQADGREGTWGLWPLGGLGGLGCRHGAGLPGGGPWGWAPCRWSRPARLTCPGEVRL